MTTPNLQFYALSALPATLEADAFYFVENGNYAESYITNSSGVARQIGNSLMINALVAEALANWGGAGGGGASNQVIIVPDIAARDALTTTADTILMVLVIDATGDATVSGGSALYALDFAVATWYKLTEYGSLGAIVDWSYIVNGPTSTAAQLDDAVDKAHSHANMAQLNKIGEDANGDLTYGGAGVKTQWIDKNW